jgi:O-antigen chain-terminating methyltransferase
VQAEARVQQAEVLVAQPEAHTQQCEARATQAEARAVQAEIHIAELLNSTSWRMTAPLRWAGTAIRCVIPSALKPSVKVLLQHAALYVGRRPWLKRVVLSVLEHFPGLKSRLFLAVLGTAATATSPATNVPTELAHLSPRARQIYADLKTAIERQGKGRG